MEKRPEDDEPQGEELEEQLKENEALEDDEEDE
jgi:hypothetical protein